MATVSFSKQGLSCPRPWACLPRARRVLGAARARYVLQLVMCCQGHRPTQAAPRSAPSGKGLQSEMKWRQGEGRSSGLDACWPPKKPPRYPGEPPGHCRGSSRKVQGLGWSPFSEATACRPPPTTCWGGGTQHVPTPVSGPPSRQAPFPPPQSR